MKIVLDTNVIVSRYMSRRGAPARLYERWEQGHFDVLVTDSILDEYADVFSRPGIQRRTGVVGDEVGILIAEIARNALVVEPEDAVTNVSADPDDDIFLECAVAGSADYIVSGDQHLLALGSFRGIAIVPPAMFVLILDDES